MKQTLLISLLSIFVLFGNAQINTNEKLVYVASYNMNGLMTTMAQLSIETELLKTSKKTYLHTSISASTFTKWDSYFKMRDLYESYVNPKTLKPSLYKRKVSEADYTKTEKYVFSSDGKTISSTSKRKTSPEVKRKVTIGGNTVDIVSLIQKLRHIDFQNLKPGSKKTFTIVFDEKEFTIAFKYLGKETVNAGNLGSKSCYKISIAANSDVLTGKDKNLMWLTVDNKVPALIKFSIPVGTGQLKLKTVSTIK